MKSVLIVDAPPMLREFLKEKFAAENITVEVAEAQRDALPKFLSVLPDLVIVNIENSVSDVEDFLAKKQADPNGKKVPVIVSGPVITHEEASDLVQYGVIKYFTRPIQFDLFFDSIGRVLHSAFAIDSTPCVLDMHLNHHIIFIEIAKGLNREKISLLKYKIADIIQKNNLTLPKLVLMMSDLSLSYVDGLNLELLLTNITEDRRVLRRNIKILSFDPFVSDFIEGHPLYEGIEVVQDLSKVITSLVDSVSDSVENVISDKILASSEADGDESMGIRFFSDAETVGNNGGLSSAQPNIAIIDNDISVIAYLKRAVETVAEVSAFASGKDFLSKIQQKHFDLVITGMYMPDVTGLDILKFLIDRRIDLPVIVYSNVVQKELIMQTLKLGASSYLIKPQPEEVIVQKVLEVLNARK
ncbi:MAG: response regulator [Treponema sp.]|uniref:response regulator n=1 Tax=Treponema sp. TaxID=166 RepID=UPI0025DFAA0B|nr:response regulator [Treponema sp.]MBR0495149.1 response regulator [Treponema sp.]